MKIPVALVILVLVLPACGPEAEKLVVLDVTGTMCQKNCAPAVERMLMGVEGVRRATVTHATGTAEVVCLESVEVAELTAAVVGPTYRATLREVKEAPPRP